MTKKQLYYLGEIQGIIASCAIENQEHDIAYERINKLIDEYGHFARIDWDLCMKYCYGEGE